MTRSIHCAVVAFLLASAVSAAVRVHLNGVWLFKVVVGRGPAAVPLRGRPGLAVRAMPAEAKTARIPGNRSQGRITVKPWYSPHATAVQRRR